MLILLFIGNVGIIMLQLKQACSKTFTRGFDFTSVGPLFRAHKIGPPLTQLGYLSSAKSFPVDL